MPKHSELPPTIEISQKTRDELIAELLLALSDSKVLCNEMGDHMKTSEADISSEAFSLGILSIGSMILIKSAYNEYRAFQAMKRQNGEDERSVPGHSVTMGEFIKYRCGYGPIRFPGDEMRFNLKTSLALSEWTSTSRLIP